MKREITISKNGNKSSLKWGYVGEKNTTHIIIELPDRLVKCDYCQAEFSSKGIKTLTDKLEIVDGKVTAVIPFESTACAGKLSVQIVGYVVDEDGGIFAIGKSSVFSGQIFPSVTGKITDEKADIPLLHRIWAKIEAWAGKIHEHDNKTILDGFTSFADNQFYNGLDKYDLRWKYGTLRFVGDGAVVKEIEEIERDGKKFLRLYLHWSNGVILEGQCDFIDIPVNAVTQIEEENPGFDFTLNGGVLELPTGSDGGVNGIPVVHTLPTDATDGDMCLYSPANTIELADSGKRIYFDWEEFAKPVSTEEETHFSVFSGENLSKHLLLFDIWRTSSSNDIAISWRDNDYEQKTNFEVSFENGEFSYAQTKKGREVLAEYFSVDELPKYFDMPSFDNISVDDNNPNYGTAPCFYAPYRLMVYRGGEWHDAVDAGLTEEQLADIKANIAARHEHGNKDVLDNITLDMFEGRVPAVHTLPQNATDGDLCLYAPANKITVEDGGKRIYFNWDKIKHYSANDNLLIYVFYLDGSEVGRININGPLRDYTFYRKIDEEKTQFLEVRFKENSNEFEGGFLGVSFQSGAVSGRDIRNLEKLPLYFDLPSFNSIYEMPASTTDAFLFHTQYSLMVYQGGEWQNAQDSPQKTIEENLPQIAEKAAELIDTSLLTVIGSGVLE